MVSRGEDKGLGRLKVSQGRDLGHQVMNLVSEFMDLKGLVSLPGGHDMAVGRAMFSNTKTNFQVVSISFQEKELKMIFLKEGSSLQRVDSSRVFVQLIGARRGFSGSHILVPVPLIINPFPMALYHFPFQFLVSPIL